MIPTIEQIINYKKSSNNDNVNVLVISPTRELAQQIATETEKLLTFHSNSLKKVVTMVGGTNKNKDIKALRGKTPFVVATPGRLLDHLQSSNLAERMVNLNVLILDEADQLLGKSENLIDTSTHTILFGTLTFFFLCRHGVQA